MAITLTGAAGLFTRLGKLYFALQTLNENRAPTTAGAFPKEVNDYLIEFDNVSNVLQDVLDGAAPAITGGQNGLAGMASWLQQSAAKLVIQMVKDDNPQKDAQLTTALIELIRQMVASSDTVDASVVAATPAAGASNNGNGKCVASTKRGDGKVNENIIAETITLRCTADTTEGQEVFTATGQAAVAILSQDWPKGSGCNKSITAVDAAVGNPNLLTNGSFEEEATRSDAPDDWELFLATIGTTLKITNPEVQTVIISSTPTSGYYVLAYTNPSSKIQYTEPLAYNAGQSDVQAALQLLEGLADAAVVTTGTAPNYTHTITFNGPDRGNLTILSSTNTFNVGSIAHAEVTAGSAYVFKGGRALEFDSDGAQNTSIGQKVTVLPLTQYAVNLWAMADVVPAAGVLTVDIYDGSAVINDEAGTANSFTINCTTLSNSAYAASNGSFRLPRVLPPVVYLRIYISTDISNGSSVFIDHAAMRQMEALYAGGPEVAIFSGNTRFRKGDGLQVLADSFTVTTTNDRLGLIQEWTNRVFDMAAKGLILPSNTVGTETVLDSLCG